MYYDNEINLTAPVFTGEVLSQDELDTIAIYLGMQSNSEIIRNRVATFSSTFNKKVREYLWYINELENVGNNSLATRKDVIQVEDIKFQINQSSSSSIYELKNNYLRLLAQIMNLTLPTMSIGDSYVGTSFL